MRPAALAGTALAVLALLAAYRVGAIALAQGAAPPPAEPAAAEPTNDPLGPNAACYICHMTFVREELAKTHLKADVTCIACHGVSNRHANDENIGATKPDVVFQRDEVNASCRTCHPTHDVPPEAVIARWLERKLTKSPPVCTDCHGSHRIGRPPADPAPAEDPTEAPGGGTQGTEKAPG
jgi:hypothetical protein